MTKMQHDVSLVSLEFVRRWAYAHGPASALRAWLGGRDSATATARDVGGEEGPSLSQEDRIWALVRLLMETHGVGAVVEFARDRAIAAGVDAARYGFRYGVQADAAQAAGRAARLAAHYVADVEAERVTIETEATHRAADVEAERRILTTVETERDAAAASRRAAAAACWTASYASNAAAPPFAGAIQCDATARRDSLAGAIADLIARIEGPSDRVAVI